MNTLTAQALLQAWERVQDEHPLRRSLVLLHTAWPRADEQGWGALPVGSRDRALIRLREALFGSQLDTVVDCPACGETLQLQFGTGDLHGASMDRLDAGDAPADLSFHGDGWTLDYRLPCSDDLIAAADGAQLDRDAAFARLVARCVIAARDGDRAADVDELPPALIDRLQAEMARHDPGADTRVALQCPACGHGFERAFDIGAYLWDEFDDWAQRILADVHVLAGAYGWSEADILSLSAARRSRYIAMVQA